MQPAVGGGAQHAHRQVEGIAQALEAYSLFCELRSWRQEGEDALRDASDALTLSRADRRRWFSVDEAGHHAPMDQPIH